MSEQSHGKHKERTDHFKETIMRDKYILKRRNVTDNGATDFPTTSYETVGEFYGATSDLSEEEILTPVEGVIRLYRITFRPSPFYISEFQRGALLESDLGVFEIKSVTRRKREGTLTCLAKSRIQPVG